MGMVSEMELRVVAANIQAVLAIPAKMLASMPIPEEVYQPHRGQYDAGLILQHLALRPFPLHLRILAVTDVDLCNPMLTYVFGEAELGRKFAVVSTFRLRESGDGTSAPPGVYYERLAKVALHEVAHTLSLYHCESPKCLMQVCRKVRDLDERDIGFCERCSFILHHSIGT